MAKPQQKRGKPKDTGRRVKKKVSILNTEQVDYIDWKDANLLRRFMSDRAKIRARRVTGNDTKQQREVAKAIKNAREMALLPYTNRVTTQRGRRDRDGDERRPRGERPDRQERPAGDEAPPASEFEAIEESAAEPVGVAEGSDS
ncbi:MAG: 30S ribosomal protein S18 [Actinobacteria bacterium]|nr:30S ribosomal protein S18 [Actinomycetota bacterium]